MTLRAVLGVLIAVGLAVATTWLARQQGEAPEAAAPEPVRHAPDSTMARFTTTYMDQAGRPHHRLQAEQMVHFADDDTTELTRPRLVLYREDGPPWQVRAEQGWVGPEGAEVHLENDVRMTRRRPPAGETRLTTPFLVVFPERDYAETDRPVTITDPQGRTEGVGMEAYLEEQRLVLLDEVFSRYDPPSP